MDKPPTVQNDRLADGETRAVNAFVAVLWDDPQAARRILASASFRDRALIVAWADELRRLGLQGQTDYENRERQAWRDIMDAPLSAG